jgi:hypothetical protein
MMIHWEGDGVGSEVSFGVWFGFWFVRVIDLIYFYIPFIQRTLFSPQPDTIIN